MAPHAQGAVHDHGPAARGNAGFNPWLQEPYASIEQYWNMAFRGGSLCGSV
ncbi:hypothetical protein GCM10017711_01130 [Paeniglutamicibacter sulfureus]